VSPYPPRTLERAINVLVTGGAGYIGSHACQRLLSEGHRVVALDTLSRGHKTPMDLLANEHPERFTFVQADIADQGAVRSAVDSNHIDTLMHFAAYAYVGESAQDPLMYHVNNTLGAIAMLDAIDQARSGRGVERIIFSSSCATYGDPPHEQIPVPETCPQRPTSPYGHTKLHLEQILSDYAAHRNTTDNPLALTMLRYFNVAGSDPTGVLGEDHDPETHLIPIAIQAAMGKRGSVSIFGTDYDTPDGTCVRDYVHVTDLVDAHVLAMDAMKPGETKAYNVATGTGTSVREVLEAVQRVTGSGFEIVESPRRAGDAVALYADPSEIKNDLGWSPEYPTIEQMIGHAHAWMSANPNGYGD